MCPPFRIVLNPYAPSIVELAAVERNRTRTIAIANASNPLYFLWQTKYSRIPNEETIVAILTKDSMIADIIAPI